MTAPARAGWALSAILFAILLSSIAHIPHVGTAPLLLAAVAVLAFVRPAHGLAAVVLLVPFAGVAASMRWNASVLWPEAIVCAALTGLSLDAAWRGRTIRASLSAPALIFGALILASMIASMGVVALRLGPSFTGALWTHFSQDHLVDIRGFPAIVAGIRLLEGVLLFALAARRSLSRDAWCQIAIAGVAGATVAAALNIRRLAQAASRSDDFFATIWELSHRLRWNLHYDDFNAAGSYFVLALLLAGGLALTSERGRRAVMLACAAPIAIALWLTSSRVAFIAGSLAAMTVALMQRATFAGRLRVLRIAGIAAAIVAVLGVIVLVLPQRGNQQSSLLAADVRVGLARAAGRMIATSPAFGIGLGEFYQRSGEFASPELIAKFPVAVHENAHNNFLQIAAELGITGGLAFVWLIGSGLVAIRRDPVALAALGAFVLTCIGGHPLLVAEPGFVFWTLLGAAAGTFHPDVPGARRPRTWLAVAVVAILLVLPWRIRSMAASADLEHVGIGLSSVFSTAPDGTRYKEAHGHGTLFVPAGAPYRIHVNPQTDRVVRLQLVLAGRLADIVTLKPGTWNTLTFPARSERASARFLPLEFRAVDDDKLVLWITKVETFR